MKMLDALEEVETGKLVPQATLEAWRRLLKPEIAQIARPLEPMSHEAVSSEQEDVSDLFTELENVNSEPQKESELFTEPPSAGSEQVNSEHATTSESVHTDDYKLPPIIQQSRKKIKKSKSNANRKAEAHAAS
jgi:hypothetical protein